MSLVSFVRTLIHCYSFRICVARDGYIRFLLASFTFLPISHQHGRARSGDATIRACQQSRVLLSTVAKALASRKSTVSEKTSFQYILTMHYLILASLSIFIYQVNESILSIRKFWTSSCYCVVPVNGPTFIFEVISYLLLIGSFDAPNTRRMLLIGHPPVMHHISELVSTHLDDTEPLSTDVTILQENALTDWLMNLCRADQ